MSQINLSILSKQRSGIMGLAILFIMMFHSHHFLPFGNVGVDMFLICSGIGIYYSLSKGRKFGDYFYKRFLRIYPQFFIISLLFYGVINTSDSISLLYHLTTIDFWMYSCKDFWYVPCILAFYVFSPLLFWLLNKSVKIFALLFFLYILLYLFIRIVYIPQFYFTTILDRIPSFLCGMMIGKCIYEGTNLSVCTKYVITTIIISFILYVLKYIGFNYDLIRCLLYPMMAIAFCIWGGAICEERKIASFVLGFLGLISYEIYLIHERILFVLSSIFQVNLILALIIAFVCAIPLSYIFKRGYNRLVKELNSKLFYG